MLATICALQKFGSRHIQAGFKSAKVFFPSALSTFPAFTPQICLIRNRTSKPMVPWFASHEKIFFFDHLIEIVSQGTCSDEGGLQYQLLFQESSIWEGGGLRNVSFYLSNFKSYYAKNVNIAHKPLVPQRGLVLQLPDTSVKFRLDSNVTTLAHFEESFEVYIVR
ncbi:hypothetical protein CROQUDRAFT_321136 [Cronartium quercuum f. sp. fusiforme G11]|uniref:Uncharacterized protein n=1 Tax=Cronartium quercuum f. sp. fusiforme G11 TaxID=708437 RepID=A0A9P6NPX8_9BASI|nr:hypothetical protein CROQUDRAFT_321136 [Cronartium quercuum f. sp. fusiforme G11]